LDHLSGFQDYQKDDPNLAPSHLKNLNARTLGNASVFLYKILFCGNTRWQRQKPQHAERKEDGDEKG